MLRGSDIAVGGFGFGSIDGSTIPENTAVNCFISASALTIAVFSANWGLYKSHIQ